MAGTGATAFTFAVPHSTAGGVATSDLSTVAWLPWLSDPPAESDEYLTIDAGGSRMSVRRIQSSTRVQGGYAMFSTDSLGGIVKSVDCNRFVKGMVALGCVNGKIRIISLRHQQGSHFQQRSTRHQPSSIRENLAPSFSTGNFLDQQQQMMLMASTAKNSPSSINDSNDGHFVEASNRFFDVISEWSSPKGQYQCNAVAWSPCHSTWLAAGFERIRGGNAVTVWDLFSSRSVWSAVDSTLTDSGEFDSNSLSPTPVVRSKANKARSQQAALASSQGKSLLQSVSVPQAADVHSGGISFRAIFDSAPGECCYSLDWIRSSSGRNLAAGLSNKYIQFFDTREPKAYRTLPTKAVYGVRCSPKNEHYVISYYEQSIYLWDIRGGSVSIVGGSERSSHHRGDKPVCTFNESSLITQLQWDPTCDDAFYCLTGKKAPELKRHQLVRLGRQVGGADEATLAAVDPVHYYCRSNNASPVVVEAFSCHPRDPNRVVVLKSDGSTMNLQSCQPGTLGWHSDGSLAVSFGHLLAQCVPASPAPDQFDITEIMKKLAMGHYGTDFGEKSLKVAQEQLAALMTDIRGGDDSAVIGKLPLMDDYNSVLWIWEWMDRTKHKLASFLKDWPYPDRYPGVCYLFSNRNTDSSGTRLEWREVEGSDSSTKVSIYCGPEREQMLRLCGWGAIGEAGAGDRCEVASTIHKLAAQRTSDGYMRAAAIAIFTLRHRNAIEMLKSASELLSDKSQANHYKLLALALAGFFGAHRNQEQKETWKELCQSLLVTIDDPYLQAIFTYLRCRLEDDNLFEALLTMEALPLYDRVAFAAVHLPDHTLQERLLTMEKQCCDAGCLYGLLLTGLNREMNCQMLLQKYVDRTYDVQSAALFVIHGGCLPAWGVSGFGLTRPASPTRTLSSSVTSLNRIPADEPLEKLQTLTNQTQKNAARYYRGVNFVDGYFNLLNQWRLYVCRGKLEALAGQLTIQNATIGIPMATSRTMSTEGGLHLGGGGTIPHSPAPSHHGSHANLMAAVTPLPTNRHNPQVMLRCSFCGKATVLLASGGGGSRHWTGLKGGVGGGGATPAMVRSQLAPEMMQQQPQFVAGGIGRKGGAICPSCKKPLPRCALCRRHMGATTGTGLPSFADVASPSLLSGNEVSASGECGGIADWFSWCQTCRHGGHARHMRQWFASGNVECPVSGCSCRCSQLDRQAVMAPTVTTIHQQQTNTAMLNGSDSI